MTLIYHPHFSKCGLLLICQSVWQEVTGNLLNRLMQEKKKQLLSSYSVLSEVVICVSHFQVHYTSENTELQDTVDQM